MAATMAMVCGSRALAAAAPFPALSRPLLHVAERASQAASFVPRAAKSEGVEPDLFEGKRDPWITLGEDEELYFPYGKADGAHSWHEGDDGTFWEGIVEVFESSGGPVGVQGTISWLYPLGVFAALYANAPSEFYVIYSSVFVWLFISFEFAKPDQPWNFEPDMYYDEELLNGAREPERPVETSK